MQLRHARMASVNLRQRNRVCGNEQMRRGLGSGGWLGFAEILLALIREPARVETPTDRAAAMAPLGYLVSNQHGGLQRDSSGCIGE